MNLEEYTSYDGLGLADLVRRRQIHPRELADAALAAIEAVNPTVNAVVAVLHSLIDQTVGQSPPDGPFVGVPFLAKDFLIFYAGIPTNAASRLFVGDVRNRDSEIVRRFKRAGLITVGKSSTSELAISAVAESVLHGPTRNPWNIELSPGGSSGGSAAAVASGIVPIAHANDAGGSIRIPAACTGLVGLKPSRGRNPLGPEHGDVWLGLVAEHVMTRSVRDSAAMLDATAGPDVGAPYFAPPPPRPFLEEVSLPPGRLRIACNHVSPTGEPVAADCRRAVLEVAELLESLGHDVAYAAPDYDVGAYSDAFLAIMAPHCAAHIEAGAARLHRTPGPDTLERINLWLLEKGRSYSATDLVRARDVLNRVTRQVGAFFQDYDVLLTPALASMPPSIGHLNGDMVDPETVWARTRSFAPFCHIFNGTGQPAISLPATRTAGGLPVGVQIVGRYAEEALLFRLAGQLETARPWSSLRPPIHAARPPKARDSAAHSRRPI